MKKVVSRYVLIFLAGISFQSCFTGVDSTPKITYSDVKKERIIVVPEQNFLADDLPEPPLEWKAGKEFYVADPKISIIFSSMSTADRSSLAGKNIYFQNIYPVQSVTGDDVTEIEFTTEEGGHLYYRENSDYAQLSNRTQLEVPFTIEMSMVEKAANAMRGKRYYAITPLWYNEDGSEAVNGLRHVPVDIIDVVPGNAVYPLRVVFKPEGTDQIRSMYMTLGQQRTSTRNFHTLFTFDNPKTKYPHIMPEIWDLIQHSQVRNGMTREECKLALGAPQTIGQRPSTMGMLEYWQYSDGILLIFEEGYLSNGRD